MKFLPAFLIKFSNFHPGKIATARVTNIKSFFWSYFVIKRKQKFMFMFTCWPVKWVSRGVFVSISLHLSLVFIFYKDYLLILTSSQIFPSIEGNFKISLKSFPFSSTAKWDFLQSYKRLTFFSSQPISSLRCFFLEFLKQFEVLFKIHNLYKMRCIWEDILLRIWITFLTHGTCHGKKKYLNFSRVKFYENPKN